MLSRGLATVTLVGGHLWLAAVSAWSHPEMAPGYFLILHAALVGFIHRDDSPRKGGQEQA
jgi:hypothetical protein